MRTSIASRAPISPAIEHYSYCPRQCGLIHLEGPSTRTYTRCAGKLRTSAWMRARRKPRRASRIERAIPLWSDRLGLRGKADVVEFRPEGPYPIEYKVGPSRGRHADAQLCAQGLCLEEMLGTPVLRGAVLSMWRHGTVERSTSHRRCVLGRRRSSPGSGIRLPARFLPAPMNDSSRTHCSLIESCLPAVMGDMDRIRRADDQAFVPTLDDPETS